MKHAFAALAGAAALAVIAAVPGAQASPRSLRADIPCPYGIGGDLLVSPPGTVLSAQNPGVASVTSATFGVATGSDFVNLSAASATLTEYYSAPLPAAGACSAGGSGGSTAGVAQVFDFVLDPGQAIAATNEIEFAYASGVSPTTASFTVGGNTFTSIGSPLDHENAFVFSGTKFVGALDASDALTTLAAAGWTEKAATGGVTAPELDAASTSGVLTLVAGILAVFAGKRRMVALKSEQLPV